MTHRPTLLAVLLLLLVPVLTAGPAEAQRRGGGFGGFGGGRSFSRPSFSRPSLPSRPPTTFSRPRATVPPPVIAPAPPPPSSVPSTGGFGSGRARGVAGAPNAPPVPASVPATGAFGAGEARGVAGATARNPISSRPPSAAPPSGAPGAAPGVSSGPRPAAPPAGAAPGSRRVEPARGSPNVPAYDRRPGWAILPFWWYPPIYAPTGGMVAPGGANPVGIFLTLALVGGLIVLAVVLLRRRQ